MKLIDIITPEVLDKSIHPGRELTDADIKESAALIKDNQGLIDVFKKCHRTCADQSAMELSVSDPTMMSVVINLDRAIRVATADGTLPAA